MEELIHDSIQNRTVLRVIWKEPNTAEATQIRAIGLSYGFIDYEVVSPKSDVEGRVLVGQDRLSDILSLAT
jgi:hypothetical protein